MSKKATRSRGIRLKRLEPVVKDDDNSVNNNFEYLERPALEPEPEQQPVSNNPVEQASAASYTKSSIIFSVFKHLSYLFLFLYGIYLVQAFVH